MNISQFKALITEHWVPPLITGIFGLVVGLSVSFFDAEISENRYFLEKQATTADRIALQFSKYVENWRRIIKLKNFVDSEKRKPSENEVEQLKLYVSSRNAARDELFSALDSLHLYFDKETSDLSSSFRIWDEEQSNKLTKDLPNIKEWQDKERNILLSMRKGLLDE
jgi:hypothetical protein